MVLSIDLAPEEEQKLLGDVESQEDVPPSPFTPGSVVDPEAGATGDTRQYEYTRKRSRNNGVPLSHQWWIHHKDQPEPQTSRNCLRLQMILRDHLLRRSQKQTNDPHRCCISDVSTSTHPIDVPPRPDGLIIVPN